MSKPKKTQVDKEVEYWAEQFVLDFYRNQWGIIDMIQKFIERGDHAIALDLCKDFKAVIKKRLRNEQA